MRKNISMNLVRNISPLSLLVLGACTKTSLGGNGNSVSGIVQNGPLENAFAFLDYDNDGIYNNDDVGILTAADGSYQISTTKTEEYTLVAQTTDTTVDAATGAGYGAGVTLKAPEGSSMITPNTTLIENILSADKALGVAAVGLTAADVTADVAKALGLEGADLLNFNAYADDTDFTDDQKETALKVQLSNNKIMTVVNSFAAAGEGSGLTEAVAFQTALGSVVKVLNQKVENIQDNAIAIAAGAAGKTAVEMTLDFATDADLTLINDEIQADVLALQVAGTTIDTTQFNNVAGSTQSAIKLVVDKIDTIKIADVLAGTTSAEDMGNIFSIVNVLKEEVQAAALVVKSGGALSIAMASDAGISAALTNKAPTDLQLSGSVITTDETDGSVSPETVTIDENVSDLGLIVGTVTTIDAGQPDGVDHKYVITADLDGAYFAINEFGVLSFIASPDFENKSSYKVAVQVTDAGYKSFVEIFNVSINNINEIPTLTVATDGSVMEAAAINTIENSLVGTDPENDVLTYKVVGQTATSGTYTVDGTYGTLALNESTGAYTYTLDNSLAVVKALGAESKETESFSVIVTDGTLTTVAQTLSFEILGENGVPTLTVSTGESITEDVSPNTIIGQLTGVDPEGGALDYQVAAETVSAGNYTVTGDYGTLVLTAATGAYTYTLDNTKASIQALGAGDTKTESFSVKVSDGFTLTDAQNLSLTIKGANDAPSVVALSASKVVEGTAGAIVGAVSATDIESDTITYTIAAGGDGASFEIDASNNLKLKSTVTADLVAKSSYSVTVNANDGTDTTATAFTVSVTDVNDAPTLTVPTTVASVTEDADPSTITGTLVGSDPEGSALTYEVDGAVASGASGTYSATGDYGTLTMGDDTGEYTYTLDNTKASVQALGASDTKTESFSVKVSDGELYSATESLTFTITGAYDAPPLLSATTSVTGSTISVSIYADESVASELGDGLGALDLKLGYDASAFSLDTATLTFLTGFTGLAGVQDTSAGTLLLGGYAYPSTTDFDSPLIQFDLAASGSLADTTLSFSLLTIDDAPYPDQTLPLDIV